MATVPQMKVWTSASGSSYAAVVDKFQSNIANWLIPARALGKPADEYVKWVIENYKPDNVFGREDGTFICFSWKKEFMARKYCNEVNALIRKSKFTI